MLDILGKQYIVDTSIAFLKKMNEERYYRAYVTDALSVIAEQNGATINNRYADMYIKPKKNHSASDVKRKILHKFGKED